MRSKCRCSSVLQFTFRHAVCCVLHRPQSQVIHCTVLFSLIRHSFQSTPKTKPEYEITSHHGRARFKPMCRPSCLKAALSPRAVFGAPHPHTGHRRAQDQRTGRQCRTRRGRDRRRAISQRTRTISRPGTRETHFSIHPALGRANLNNDPSAGSPTETLLRLLLPLDAQVWLTFQLQW